MIRTGLSIVITGAATFLAAVGIDDSAMAPVAQRPATAMASYVETPGSLAIDGATPSAQEIRPGSDGLYYLDANINGGQRLRFLVDTGASVTVLTARDARLIGLDAAASVGGPKLRTAGGARSARFGTIDRMSVAGRGLRNIEAAVIDDGLPVSLLGQNALAELGTITLGKGRMTID